MSPDQSGIAMVAVLVFLLVIAAVVALKGGEELGEIHLAAADAEVRRLDYVAQAGLQHATWQARNAACTGDFTIAATAIGPDSYTATTTGGGSNTTLTLLADQDAWIRSDNPTNTGSGDQHIRSEGTNFERALYRFDLSSLPADSAVKSAVAWFYLESGKEHPEGPVTINRVTADWTEGGATWDALNDKFDPAALGMIPAQPVGGVWVSVNLTGQVQAWVNGQPNYGIALSSTAEGIHAEYKSREDGGTPPRLEVVVGTGAASPLNIQATGTLDTGVTHTLSRGVAIAYQPPGAVSLQLGVDPGEDVMTDSFYSGRNYGGATYVQVNDNGTNWQQYPLIRFGLGKVPRGAAVRSARLELHMRNLNAPGTATIHQVTRSWVEGTKSGGGTADGATWFKYDGTNSWASAGGDFNAPVVAETAIGGSEIWVSWEIAPLVERWLAGDPNYGLMIRPANGLREAEFESKEDSNVGGAPKLTIEYACECGTPCMAPQGSGKIALIGDDSSPDPDDQLKIEILESWGYEVDFYQDLNSNTINWSNYDLAYVSETVISGDVSANLANLSIGVVNEEPKLYDNLGLANGDTEHVGSSIDITDNSHYITAIFPQGALSIYNGDMEILTADTPLAAGLQTLGEFNGQATLTATDTGAATISGTAAGRRVTLPLGQHFAAGFDWTHLNNNGHLIVQRAIAWAMGADATSIANVLLVVVNPGSLTAQEDAKKALMESWSFTVNLIDESDSQANFDAAFADNDVAYIPQDISSTNLGTKLYSATIGVVNEEGEQVDELEFANNVLFKSRSEIDVKDNSHYITQPFATGLLTFVSSDQSVHMIGSGPANGLQVLGESFNTGSLWEPSLGAVEVGGQLKDLSAAAGRRVQLPWGGGTFNINLLTDDGRTIMQRALEWGAGLDAGAPAPGQEVLLVVGDATAPSTKDTGRQALMESWGFTVTLIDDGDSQANLDAAAAANDVVYVSGTIGGGTLADKLTGSPAPIINEFNGKMDNFGLSSSTSATVNASAFSTTNATHYITLPFGGGATTVFSGSLTMPVPSGTLAPDLQTVGDVSGTLALVTLDEGAQRWDGQPAPARRAHLPFTNAETAQLTTDGETIMRRALEWGAGAEAPPPSPIAHWKLDETSGTTAADSVGSHDGTLNGVPVWTPGTIDGGLDFDGSNDYVATNSSFTPPPAGTVTFWMQVSGSPAAQGRILGLHDTWEIRHVTTGTPDGIPYGLVFDLGVSGVNTEFVTLTTIDTPDQWYHIAASYDTATDAYAVYIGGVPHKSGTYPSALSVPAANTLSLGTRTGSSNYYDGMLDDVRIYDQVLTPEQVADLAAGGGGGGGGLTCTFRDEFDALSYSNQDGDALWAGDWQEVNDGGSPTGGDIIVTGGGNPGSALRIQDDNRPITRAADLSGHTSATLTLDYKRVGLESGEYVAVSVYDGSTWTELAQFGNPPVGNDSEYQAYTQDISMYISPNFQIRLASPDGGMGNADDVNFDNLQIEASGGATCP